MSFSLGGAAVLLQQRSAVLSSFGTAPHVWRRRYGIDAFKRTGLSQMRIHRLALLSSLCLCSQIAALADTVAFGTGGADYSGIGGEPSGLSFWAMSIPHSAFSFSNPLAPALLTFDSDFEVRTGPLVSQTALSWTFAGGTFHRDHGTSATWVSLASLDAPTCEAAGLVTANLGYCNVRDSIDGTFLDRVTFSLGPIISINYDYDPYTVREFQLTGALSFFISPELAHVGGVSTGPYFGSFTATGDFRHALETDPGFFDPNREEFSADYWYNAYPTWRIEVVGTTVPEPSSIIFLASIIVGILAVNCHSRSRHQRRCISGCCVVLDSRRLSVSQHHQESNHGFGQEEDGSIYDQLHRLTDNVALTLPPSPPSPLSHRSLHLRNRAIEKHNTGATEHLPEYQCNPSKVNVRAHNDYSLRRCRREVISQP